MGILKGAFNVRRVYLHNFPTDLTVEALLDMFNERLAHVLEAPGPFDGKTSYFCSPAGPQTPLTYARALPTGNRWLHLGVATVTDEVPPAVKRELKDRLLSAAASGNPSGFPSKAQATEAEVNADQQLETRRARKEFRKYRFLEIVVDLNNLVAYVPDSETAQEAFERARRPYEITATLDVGPEIPLEAMKDAAAFGVPTWAAEKAALAQVEMGLWLWWLTSTARAVGDRVSLAPQGLLTCVSVDGVSDSCVIRADSPTSTPEARQCLKQGKLPRVMRASLVWGDRLADVTLRLDTYGMTVHEMTLPELKEAETAAEVIEARLFAMVDLFNVRERLVNSFIKLRTSADWSDTAKKIKEWKDEEEA
jgi:hypothetical protein